MNPQHVPFLLADDDADDRMLAAEALSESSTQNPLLTVNDGAELLDRLRGTGKYAEDGPLRPAVVLLDLNMPKIDGREALRAIKSDSSLASLPVVILTTSRAAQDAQFAMDHGALAFLTKPSSFEGLVELMNGLPLVVSGDVSVTGQQR
jgi:CheY-like chemotaxis protein